MAKTIIEEIDLGAVIDQINALMRCVAPEGNGPITLSQQEAARQWQDIINVVLGFRDLGDDWDGLGAKAPPTCLIESAVELAQYLRHHDFLRPCRTVAGPDGEIVLEWQESGIYLEAEVCKPDTAEWMLVLPDGTTKHWITPLTNPSRS